MMKMTVDQRFMMPADVVDEWKYYETNKASVAHYYNR